MMIPISALLILSLFSSMLYGKDKTLSLNEQQQQYPMGHLLSLYEDTSSLMSIENIVDPSTIFSPSQSEVPNFGFTDSVIWFRFKLRNDSTLFTWWLDIGHARLEHVTLYQFTPQGWQAQHRGMANPLNNPLLSIRSDPFPITIAPGESQTFYVRVQSRTALSLPVNLWQPLSFNAFIEFSSLLNGANLAVIIILTLYSLLTWLLTRKLLYLQFALFSFSVFLFWSTVGGHFHQYIGLLPQAESIRIISFFASLVNLCYLIFARNFLQSRHYAPLWDRLLILLIGIIALEMVLSIWVNFSILARFITLVMLLSSLVVFSTAIVILARGYKPAQLFIIVQAILFPSIVIRALGMFSILPIMFGQISIFITISILMPLPVMLYNRRMNFLAREKETALAQAMKIEQMMVQELEKQVLERTHKLKVAQTRAEEANLAKGEFLAVMSHELRTPITAIAGAAQLIDTNSLNEQNHHLLKTVRHANKQLLTLIDDVLDLAKMDAGQLKLKNKIFSLKQVLLDVITLLTPEAEERGLILKLETETLPEQVQGDASRLRQIITNLISNAIKYTDHGLITVRAELLESDDGMLPIYISVEDTGRGIPNRLKTQIFRPFIQVNSNTSEPGSVGLGLAICKRLVTEMNGTIGVESELMQGSLFWFTVDLLLPSKQSNLVKTHFKSVAPIHILLVEDIAINREIITLLLTQDGHRVTGVASGQEALDLLNVAPFDLVLMDIQMAGTDGLQASVLIRQQAHQNCIPIIALTASSSLQMSVKCRAAGMNALVSKPLCLQTLYATLAAHTTIPMLDCLEPLDKQQIMDPLYGFSDIDSKRITAISQQTLIEEGDKLTTAWANQNLILLALAAHKIAGCAAMTGLTELSNISLKLEAAATAADIEQLYILMDLYNKYRKN
ncbi:hypothetical protein BAE46_06995 [Glaciecola punicea]|nr:hypothetical protein BAE46_06995 [Glaciecola punicea]